MSFLLGIVFLFSGLASWFTPYQAEYVGGHFCAVRNPALHGRSLRVVYGGYHQTCKVIGWGPAPWTGRVIDLSPLMADDLHMRSAGVVPVRIYFVR